MVLYRWWFLFTTSAAGLGAGVYLGLLEKLWHIDVTKLSIATIILYFGYSVFIGWLTAGDKATMRKHIQSCWFAAECMMALGMMGTILGWLIMLNSVFTGLIAPAEVIQRAAPGLATICVTTFVGLLCSFMLKAQLVNLEYLIPDEK